MKVKKEVDVKETPAIETVTHRNFPQVPKVVFGKGSFDQLGEILLPA